MKWKYELCITTYSNEIFDEIFRKRLRVICCGVIYYKDLFIIHYDDNCMQAYILL